MTEALQVACIAVQKRAVQFTKKPYLPLFSSETAEKFMLSKKSFRPALQLVAAHLHGQNQVAHALRTRDFWLEKLSIHFQYISHDVRTSIRNLNCILPLWITIARQNKKMG